MIIVAGALALERVADLGRGGGVGGGGGVTTGGGACVGAWRSQVLRFPPPQRCSVLLSIEWPVLRHIIPQRSLQLKHVVLAHGQLSQQQADGLFVLLLDSICCKEDFLVK